jgi:hypothetical protein
LISLASALRSDGEDVVRIIDSSVSSSKDLVERFEDPMNVMKGCLGFKVGESQRPKREISSALKMARGKTHLWNDKSTPLSPIP